MAIAQMTKFMIVTHRSEAVDVLEALQQEGIAQVLDAERAMVSKDWPELHIEAKRPRDLEDIVSRLGKATLFLKDYAEEDPSVSIFSPLVSIDKKKYSEVVEGEGALDLLEAAEAAESDIERLSTEHENVSGRLDGLVPWESLETPVEEIGELRAASCFTGLLPHQHYDEIIAKIAELGGAVQLVDGSGNMHSCMVVCLKDMASDIQKILRSGDFEVVSFEGMSGSVSELIADCKEKLSEIEGGLDEARGRAGEIARKRLSLQILCDHYENLLGRAITHANAPATDSAVLLEGWVRDRDYAKLEKMIGGFEASSLGRIEISEGEEPPVEIENNAAFEPFESITRLYGMPNPRDVDPTAFLAPFFALFFGICLTDAIYGIVLVGILWWMLKKLQGDKKFITMLLFCSVLTIGTGAVTGGWCGDAILTVLPEGSAVQNVALGFRNKLMIFDPMTQPMVFFGLSLGLGYIQILFGLCIALYNNLRLKDYASAMFEQVTWLIFLNSLLVFGLSKGGILPKGLSGISGFLAIIQVVLIFLFTERKSGMAGRIGGGVFAVFGTVFYFGDVLSYVRLMALGMVTGGLGMAINILSKLLMDSGKIGFVFGLVLFVGGHLFNLAMGVLSAFVHSLRLQFVEFFPKFLAGGGKDFVPLRKEFKHVFIKRK